MSLIQQTHTQLKHTKMSILQSVTPNTVKQHSKSPLHTASSNSTKAIPVYFKGK